MKSSLQHKTILSFCSVSFCPNSSVMEAQRKAMQIATGHVWCRTNVLVRFCWLLIPHTFYLFSSCGRGSFQTFFSFCLAHIFYSFVGATCGGFLLHSGWRHQRFLSSGPLVAEKDETSWLSTCWNHPSFLSRVLTLFVGSHTKNVLAGRTLITKASCALLHPPLIVRRFESPVTDGAPGPTGGGLPGLSALVWLIKWAPVGYSCSIQLLQSPASPVRSRKPCRTWSLWNHQTPRWWLWCKVLNHWYFCQNGERSSSCILLFLWVQSVNSDHRTQDNIFSSLINFSGFCGVVF